MEKKITLVDSLKTMQDFDEGSIDLTFDDYKNFVGEVVADKVDSCYLHRLNLESRIEVAKKQIEDFNTIKKGLENSLKAYKEYIDFALKSTNTTKIMGKKYSLSLTKRKGIEINDINLDVDKYLEFNLLMPDVVKQEYVLDKVKFKKLCAANSDIMEKYAKEKETVYSQFRPITK